MATLPPKGISPNGTGRLTGGYPNYGPPSAASVGNLEAGANITLTPDGPKIRIAATVPTVPTFVDAATVSGVIDGSNRVFTLPSAPNPPSSLQLPKNGQWRFGSGIDYVLSGVTITWNVAPQVGDSVGPAWYRT